MCEMVKMVNKKKLKKILKKKNYNIIKLILISEFKKKIKKKIFCWDKVE